MFAFRCQCAPGWYGVHCTISSTDCNSGSDLCGHGICVSQKNGYKCICDQVHLFISLVNEYLYIMITKGMDY